MQKYPKLRRYGHESTTGLLDQPVTVLEKMDGANFRFTMGKNVSRAPDDKLIFGSRNVVYKNEKDVDKSFEHAIEYVREQIPTTDPNWWAGNVERESSADSVTLFGEAMHPHTIDYDWDNTPNVLLFDGHSEEYGWFSWRDVETAANTTNIPTVPLVERNATINNADQIPTPDTSAYRDGFPEGVVLRRNSGGDLLRAKYRTEDFLDRHSSASKANQGDGPDDAAKLAHELLRKENWVEKHIHKYEDRGRTVEMDMMETLWRDVFDDIIEEEYETIFLGNYTIDTKEFRSHIASQTAEILREYIRRPEGSVLNE
jgi:predicted transcriptional regulator